MAIKCGNCKKQLKKYDRVEGVKGVFVRYLCDACLSKLVAVIIRRKPLVSQYARGKKKMMTWGAGCGAA
jgi:hypothetical protein